MNYPRLKIWSITTLSAAFIGIVIRAIWQIVVIPTPKTMLIFIPLIIALVGVNALVAYLIFRPARLRSLPFSIGLTAMLTAGLLAGVTHFVRFIISPQADPFLSKVISYLIVLSSVSAYFILLYIIWSLRRKDRDDGQQEV